jgi:hypothetical protein
MVSFSFPFRSNARRSALRVLSTVLLVAASIGLLAGCDSGTSAPMGEVPVGTWESSFGELYTVTRNSVSYTSGFDSEVKWEADIVYVDDSRLNGGDTSVTTGGDTAVNPGFAVIRYDSAVDASWGEEGKFNVFRWADGTTTGERVMTQGGKYNDDFSEITVFDTMNDAATGATNEAGFFGLSSTVTLQE